MHFLGLTGMNWLQQIAATLPDFTGRKLLLSYGLLVVVDHNELNIIDVVSQC